MFPFEWASLSGSKLILAALYRPHRDALMAQRFRLMRVRNDVGDYAYLS
jgi:hypothetical protein